MAREERLLKILAGISVAGHELGLGNESGVMKDEINSGILSLKFRPLNLQQMREDLAFLEAKGLVERSKDGNVVRYALSERAERIARNVIKVWEALRSD